MFQSANRTGRAISLSAIAALILLACQPPKPGVLEAKAFGYETPHATFSAVAEAELLGIRAVFGSPNYAFPVGPGTVNGVSVGNYPGLTFPTCSSGQALSTIGGGFACVSAGGSSITALTGDGTATGPGSATLTVTGAQNGQYTFNAAGQRLNFNSTSSAASATLLSDGTSYSYLNSPVALGLVIGDSTFGQYTNSTNTYWGSSSSTSAYEYLDEGASAKLHFGVSATSATIQYDAKTADTATAPVSFQGQNALAGASTNVNGGGFSFVSGTPATSSGNPGMYTFNMPGGGAGSGAFYGGYKFQYNASDVVQLGEYSGSYGAIWFVDGGNPTSTNWAFLGNSSSSYFNAPSSNMYFGIGGTYYMALNFGSPTQFVMGASYFSPEYAFDMSTTAKMHFVNNSTSASIVYDAPGSDTATAALTVLGQGAYASAATNVNGGDVQIGGGAGVGSGVAGDLKLTSGLKIQQTTKTANYTIDSGSLSGGDEVILCNFSAGHTVTLPTPTGGRIITIKDISGTAATNNITIARHASEQIEGVSASFVLASNYGRVTLLSDATNWWIVQ